METSLELCRVLLGDWGYAVLTAGSGSEALGILSRAAVDVLLTDQEMPEMNGERLAREARRLYPRLPIVLMSGCGNGQNLSALPLVDAFVPKPELSTRLRATLSNLLNGRAPQATGL